MSIRWTPNINRRQRIGLGGAALLALGVAGGVGAVSLTRPPVEMAPTVSTAISNLSTTHGIVTVRGQVAAIYGDRFLVQDRTGRALVDAGRNGAASVAVGSPVLVQGRFDDGQLRARFLVDESGSVREVGPPSPPHHRPGPPPPGGPGAPPPLPAEGTAPTSPDAPAPTIGAVQSLFGNAAVPRPGGTDAQAPAASLPSTAAR